MSCPCPVCVWGSLAVFLSMLLMAFVWGLWALLAIVRHERILHRCVTLNPTRFKAI